ncbi:transport permease protein [Flexivirga endophytica]|uniref:Transport permease protein n=1 Tax=Flexivirga endophytica TaxID=1849103 RepID=A0A916TH09_9MICO|nr:ABC transporter permease [Flexivirga endophytica]GGB45143.1 transport permease protein [Flexivirga endophytica]GHB68986.1 transport permease protein [Flexivirga endophytica]
MTQAQTSKTSPGNGQPSPKEVRELVDRFGLKRAGARAPLTEYTRELWTRRHFVLEFSKATNASGYARSFLGQAWQVLTPLLNAAVYYLIFGLLIGTRKGVPNYLAFLVIGVFVFQFIQGSVTSGARSLQSHQSLARTLRFPRAVFPVSSTSIALQHLLASLVVLVPIVLFTGEPVRLQWLEVLPALAMQIMFCAGLAFIFARIGTKIPDVSQMLPFALRVWFYASGIMFSIPELTKDKPHVREFMEANPATIYVDLYRSAFLESGQSASLSQWLQALAWGVGVLVVGYVFFWKAEESYGRD